MNNVYIDVLNSFLRGELSAVETHKIAVSKLSKSPFLHTLRKNLASHEARVQQIQGEIVTLGGEPASSSGVWGAFAKLVEGGAAMLGDKTAIAALEEGEDHGKKEYQEQLEKVAQPLRPIVQSLLAQQLESHKIMSGLKRKMSEPKPESRQPGS